MAVCLWIFWQLPVCQSKVDHVLPHEDYDEYKLTLYSYVMRRRIMSGLCTPSGGVWQLHAKCVIQCKEECESALYYHMRQTWITSWPCTPTWGLGRLAVNVALLYEDKEDHKSAMNSIRRSMRPTSQMCYPTQGWGGSQVECVLKHTISSSRSMSWHFTPIRGGGRGGRGAWVNCILHCKEYDYKSNMYSTTRRSVSWHWRIMSWPYTPKQKE